MIILQKQFLCYATADYNLLMFNPLEMAELTRNIVCKNNQRKYYRFRSSRFYGGIATADCGCCLRCVFCWSWNIAANPEGFQLQLKALENLNKYKVNVHPACMISFSTRENIAALRKRLKAINPAFENFEVEELILYPAVEERLKKMKVKYITCYEPGSIPAEHI